MGSAYQHQELRVVRQVLDEWLAGWSAVFGIVTEDLIRIAAGNVEETVVAECHSGGAVKTTGLWHDKHASGVLPKVMSQN